MVTCGGINIVQDYYFQEIVFLDCYNKQNQTHFVVSTNSRHTCKLHKKVLLSVERYFH